ncbi:hypothetical protein DPMN_173828 [Dreissena polymorpha]|uniref:Uncharacterized protein n=1 Tax=Dreissena polymorpha TaxID=45954 RepID=A0A9D4II00_DREPO|nr:hypothetical protein DPMN_173828 [Dreissena polymorpha]
MFNPANSRAELGSREGDNIRRNGYLVMQDVKHNHALVNTAEEEIMSLYSSWGLTNATVMERQMAVSSAKRPSPGVLELRLSKECSHLRDQYRDLPVTKPVSRHPIHYTTDTEPAINSLLTRFCYSHTSGHVFQRTVIIFEFSRGIITTNVRTNFEHDKDIIGTTFLTKFHDNQVISVTFRVFARKNFENKL